jgi:hypothetical protein
MMAPVTVLLVVVCLLLALAGVLIAVFALFKYASTKEPSLVIGALALLWAAIALLIQGLTLGRHFS